MNFDNFSIRLLRMYDLSAYYQLIERNRKRLEDFFTGTVSKTQTLEKTETFLKEITKKAEEKTYFPFVIVDTVTDLFVGFVDFKNIDWSVPKAEIGFYMDEKYAGKGYGSRALSLITEHGFDVLGFKKLFLRTHQSNSASRRIAEKCGFEMEGTLRRDYKTTAGELIDLLYYGKLSKG